MAVNKRTVSCVIVFLALRCWAQEFHFLEGAQGSCCRPQQPAAIKSIVENPEELHRHVGRLWATSELRG